MLGAQRVQRRCEVANLVVSASLGGSSQAMRLSVVLRGRSGRLVVLPACGILAAGGPLVATSSGRFDSRSATRSSPVTLRAGDQVVVSGSKLRCAVSTAASASHPLTLICGIGDLQSPLPGTYAFAIADQ